MTIPPDTKIHGTQFWHDGRPDGPAIVYSVSALWPVSPSSVVRTRSLAHTCDWSSEQLPNSILGTVYMHRNQPKIWMNESEETMPPMVMEE